eukprot:TRINITY_DN8791_c0_g1_i1.p1 TRINITY_DN8791_c0_g1~~TRINITY_DN8791_c0_g1_i1.p1  ORF type:complete len:688 (-),score=131.76 TRINITY_DN8791_c0_g1_i1:44-2107(-)
MDNSTWQSLFRQTQVGKRSHGTERSCDKSISCLPGVQSTGKRLKLLAVPSSEGWKLNNLPDDIMCLFVSHLSSHRDVCALMQTSRQLYQQLSVIISSLDLQSTYLDPDYQCRIACKFPNLQQLRVGYLLPQTIAVILQQLPQLQRLHVGVPNSDLEYPVGQVVGKTAFERLSMCLLEEFCAPAAVVPLCIVPALGSACPNLRTISLYGAPPYDGLPLGALAIAFPQLTELAVDCNGCLNPQELAIFAASCRNITKLELKHLRLSTECATALTRGGLGLSVRSLALRYALEDTEEIVVRVLNHFHNVHELDLTGINSGGAAAITELTKMHSLTALAVSLVTQDNAELLLQCTQLQQLSIDAQCSDKLLNKLTNALPLLHTFAAHNGSMSGQGVAPFVTGHPNLTDLTLAGSSGCSNAVLRHIALKCTQLTRLDVSRSGGRLTNAGIRLLSGYPVASRLRELSVAGARGLTTEALTAINSRFQSLRVLYIEATIAGSEAAILSLALSCPHLTQLRVTSVHKRGTRPEFASVDASRVKPTRAAPLTFCHAEPAEARQFDITTARDRHALTLFARQHEQRMRDFREQQECRGRIRTDLVPTIGGATVPVSSASIGRAVSLSRPPPPPPLPALHPFDYSTAATTAHINQLALLQQQHQQQRLRPGQLPPQQTARQTLLSRPAAPTQGSSPYF